MGQKFNQASFDDNFFEERKREREEISNINYSRHPASNLYIF